MKTGADLRFQAGSWQEAAHDIYIGLLVGMGHVYTIFFQMPYNYLFGTTTKPALQQSGELKVVGVGFGRTGTYSVKLALEELGLPTLHTQHLYESENENIFKMWTDLIFQPSLDAGHAFLGEPDFDVITQHGFQATMDFPVALYYKEIMAKYPDCKFILTTRENSEVWFRSWESMTKSISTPANLGGIFLSGVQRYSIYLRWLFAVVNKDDSFITSSIPKIHQNKESAIESYEEHNRMIRELIPSDRLLEYSVKQGWKPLCDFLEIGDCPDRPFPKTNSARSVQVQSIRSTVVPLVFVLFIVFTLFARTFQRVTGRTVLQWVQHKTSLLPVFLRKTLIGEKEYQAAYLKKHDDI
jgi:hypothetical protein